MSLINVMKYRISELKHQLSVFYFSDSFLKKEFKWTVLTCLLKPPFCRNDWLQIKQVIGLFSSPTVLMYLFRLLLPLSESRFKTSIFSWAIFNHLPDTFPRLDGNWSSGLFHSLLISYQALAVWGYPNFGYTKGSSYG